MKRIITCILLLLNIWLPAGNRPISLQKALDLKLVNAFVKSLGGYQGNCIQIALQNLGKEPLLVTVETGRRLAPADKEQQDILITGEQIIALKINAISTFTVSGYCCQMHHRAPAKGSEYCINKMADSNLVTLARFLNAHLTDPQAAQLAVWAISDNIPGSMVPCMNDSVPEIRTLICLLKNEKVPWYSFVTGTYLFKSGYIQTCLLWLKGDLVYSSDKICYATLHVLDEQGTEVCQIIQQWVSPGLGQHYRLKLPVKGLAKGRYTVELRTNATQLASREFEI